MPNKCEFCGKEFYSDVDYESHLFFEEQKRLLSQMVDRWQAFGTILNNLYGMMEMHKVIDISHRQNIPFEEAANQYIDLMDTWFRVCKERRPRSA